jgi:hypothetical protein
MASRANNKWTVNELLSLQREYELLGMDIFQIALKHQRSPKAILYKLEAEMIINNWNEARGYTQFSIEENINNLSSSQNVDLSESNDINNRLSYLESVVSLIKNTVDIISSKVMPSSKSVSHKVY